MLAVVDGDADRREVLRVALEAQGFYVRAASDALAALHVVAREQIDAIVLNVAAHASDTVALIPLLRRTTDAPIIALAAENDVASCVASLAAGADGAIPGPLVLDELTARLWSALRRPTLLREIPVVAYRDLVIDTARRHVERAGEEIALSAREFNLLTLLAREPERVFKREDIVGRLWSPRAVKGGTIDSYISVLRAKVDRPPRAALIHTVRGVGYTLSASSRRRRY